MGCTDDNVASRRAAAVSIMCLRAMMVRQVCRQEISICKYADG